MKKKTAALAALLLLALPLQGCWNYHEVEEMSVVAGIAIDRGYEGYKYHLTLDIADTSGAGKDKPVESMLVDSEGDTLLDAMRNAVKRMGTRLNFQNCQIAIIGRAVAEDSILPLIDFFIREHEFRPTLELFVSEENTAKEILEEETIIMAIKSFEIDEMYEMNEAFAPVSSYRMLYENYNTLAGGGSSLTLASLSMKENVGAKTASLNGMAMFRKDKLVGFISAEDSKYALYAMDRVKGGVINVKAPTGNTVAALEVFENKTTVIPIVDNGAVRFAVHTQTDAALDELGQSTDVMEKENRDGFEAAAEMQLQQSISRVIRMVQQQYGVDIFGFGETLHKNDPEIWYQLQQNWDDVFRNMPVEVTSTINFRNSASKIKPAKAVE